MQNDFALRTVKFRFHDYIYLRTQLVNLVIDLVRVLMLGVNAHTDLPLHQANFKCYEYIFTGTIVNQGRLNL